MVELWANAACAAKNPSENRGFFVTLSYPTRPSSARSSARAVTLLGADVMALVHDMSAVSVLREERDIILMRISYLLLTRRFICDKITLEHFLLS